LTSWHGSCEAYAKKVAKEERKNEKVKKKLSKACPGCQMAIEKNGGQWL
jgi:hypothetical protein